ncbi:MAG TPA: sigma-70 family RNA polymerase sigma factor [Frankiaceae bacterium]|nr:sigma-70 family RNA polymerase sigma factor [Frankiaceae bacterium]
MADNAAMGGFWPEAATSRADAAAAADQPRDFVEFYVAHYGQLVRYAARLTGDSEAARDIVQEALTRTFTRWLGVRNKEGYVYLVVTNLARDRWKSAQRELDALRRLSATPPPTAIRDVAVRDAVERLPKRLRDIVVLHYFADLSVEQVAAVVRRPKGTVKQRLFAARQALAEALGDRDA